MTPEQLNEIKARADAATPGPWEWEPTKRGPEWFDDEYRGAPYVPQGATLGETLIQLGDTYEGSRFDCEFIAHSRTDVPLLLEEVERLRLENERLTFVYLADTKISGALVADNERLRAELAERERQIEALGRMRLGGLASGEAGE